MAGCLRKVVRKWDMPLTMEMAKDLEKVQVAFDLQLSSWGLKKSMSYEKSHNQTFEVALIACAFAETTEQTGALNAANDVG